MNTVIPEASYKFEEVDDLLVPVVTKPNGEKEQAAWAPQPGSQTLFLRAPENEVFEVLLEGNRGGGKTAVLVASFLKHVGKGHGAAWRGIIFRREYDDLKDVWKKCEEIIPKIFPDARPNQTDHSWTFRDGEVLILRYAKAMKDVTGWKGQEWPFIGWEELTEQPNDDPYKFMMSCCRSSKPGVPKMYRSTTNPYGVGHNWVKARFRLPLHGKALRIISGEIDSDTGKVLPTRAVIHSDLRENKVLLHADPDYVQRILAAARNAEEKKAWLYGDWDVVAGGLIDDVWLRGEYAVVPTFTAAQIPAGWRIDRAYDHGQSAPFVVGWWAESNGEAIEIDGRRYGSVRGDLFLIREWYGWSGTPNVGLRLTSTKIAEGILERERSWGLAGRVKVGPADDEIFAEGRADNQKEQTPASKMRKVGVRWTKASKGSGSRKRGWDLLRNRLEGCVPDDEGLREKPGLFIADCCHQWLRTVPSLTRSTLDPDDCDKKSEDHAADMTRYRLAVETSRLVRKKIRGR